MISIQVVEFTNMSFIVHFHAPAWPDQTERDGCIRTWLSTN